jgi:hypothetical protein
MPKLYSTDVQKILDGGLTDSEVARLFRMDARTVRMRISSVTPYAKRDGTALYMIRDCAPFLVPLPEDAVERVMRMNHADLPPMLRKEYWAGMRSRQQVLQAEGELWSTDRVLEYVGSMIKDIVMVIRLGGDAIERETDLTAVQRAAVKKFLDDLMESMRVRLEANFDRKRTTPEELARYTADL